MDYNTRSIGELINDFLKKKGLEERMEEVDLNDNWESLVGPMIAKHTTSLQLKDQVLILKLNSASLRHTISFSKSDLIEKLNDKLGKETIKEVVLK